MNYQYAVIGNGRLAKHMLHYFDILGIPYTHWHRESTQPLKDVVISATHILLLISDSAIDSFAAENALLLANKKVVHCSGAHESSYAFSAHPLMTFSHELYDDATYYVIPFAITKAGPDFSCLLPGLSNPHYIIPAAKKAYYHALVVMANNFSTILWEKIIKEFSNQFNIPKSAILPIMRQTFANLETSPSALTGPLSRNDEKTIERNLAALESDPFRAVYQGFLSAYSHEEKNKL